MPTEKVAFTCPHCGRDSFHPRDLDYRYCGGCHYFVDDVAAQALSAEAIAAAAEAQAAHEPDELAGAGA
jgi:hypothetical protein